MNNTVIVKLMTNLIEKKFYNTKDEAAAKLDIYFAMNRISEEEYATDTSGGDNLRRSTDCLDIFIGGEYGDQGKTVLVLLLKKTGGKT